MQIIRSVSRMLEIGWNWNRQHTIGFVPTMGYLHQGHLSLVERSYKACTMTVVSIFVNPTQFGPTEDLQAYPRDEARDLAMLNNHKVDYVFIPTVEEMYPAGYSSYVEVRGVSELYCGASRPGHFTGVATVVNKLVNLVKPDLMFMGEKDFQQIIVLETMLRDLNHCTRIVRCPILREKDGLAMSSRNTYLSVEERKRALCLSQALIAARQMYKAGETDVLRMEATMKEIIDAAQGEIDYVAFVDKDTLLPVAEASPRTRILLAVKIGKTRLIDNMPVVG